MFACVLADDYVCEHVGFSSITNLCGECQYNVAISEADMCKWVSMYNKDNVGILNSLFQLKKVNISRGIGCRAKSRRYCFLSFEKAIQTVPFKQKT